MNEREFQNMFMFCSGFEAATLKVPASTLAARERDITAASGGAATSRKQIIGFAKFKTRADALHARETLSGRKVDAEKGNVLKAEMAKKNLHTKRGLSNEIAVPSLQPASSSAASTVNHSPHVVIESNSTASAPRNHYPADQNPAINTLYVGGLPTVIESSGLRKVFGRTEGFKRLSYKVKNQQPMCFVEFDTIEQASTVMEKMYGDKIEGKVPGGIRLAFSRNALGKQLNLVLC
ncbi:hypothetical protein BY996DRAFT_4581661 [Phakopsora pachyrhizi]|nr:hypothetical protein BY996DRAFT_4581661 [Phakopsora pachyrhizi]